MLLLKNISVTFNKESQFQLKALSDIDIEFHSNDWTYIIGGNGSGKSTLLKIISGELKTDTGEIRLNNKTINNIPFHKRADKILFIEQDITKNLVGSMTVYENLVLGSEQNVFVSEFFPYKQKKQLNKIKELLSEFGLGLENRVNQQVRFLSGGEQQVVVTARIMLRKPQIILMDEFTSALDQKIAPLIIKKIKDFVTASQISVIAVSHDYSIIKDTGDRVIILANGKITHDISKGMHELTEKFILDKFYERTK
ncbi:MAG: hypothetical protein A2275_15165 [Bacteroidetes bacterium RIFOXYA12_FULL_35_11]|nr:MAG: hypothetical protein A2X01_18070 [Bacteroidetes bacterium GWF2_35_48]OFY80205.1 MAG: hypothetical protein A2275_15165 [Bacteroidetes bacterium RIFOXYA12_FULL_35_11]OFY92999.1 MAG: hypothetical protein A2309_14715 [Bacteroidetes bacterium RIFOXYB2_FULL_35_7]OFY95008.1 MAG: hypothetical protein A2491_16860 [Bacteroidetes bacterium RIFOXYC12_FULL_35_7]